jgi:diketogulonate reductase-like aldo/keto reductase
MQTSSHTVNIGSLGEAWPALGLGTWRFGETTRTANREVSIIRRAIDIGYRLFDTAEMYGDGGAETVLGRALHEALRTDPTLKRDQLQVVSKAYPHHGDVAGLRRACEASRRRLGVDAIDMYLLHWRGDIPLAESIKGFEQLQQKGWIRHWGVSNFDAPDLTELLALPGGTACATNQVYYSLSERGVETDVWPQMRAQRMPLMAYSPIDGGRIGCHAALSGLAATVDATAAQLALAWLLRQSGVMAIPKAGDEAHLLENWSSQTLTVTDAVWSALDAMFPKPTRKRPLAMR